MEKPLGPDLVFGDHLLPIINTTYVRFEGNNRISRVLSKCAQMRSDILGAFSEYLMYIKDVVGQHRLLM